MFQKLNIDPRENDDDDEDYSDREIEEIDLNDPDPGYVTDFD